MKQKMKGKYSILLILSVFLSLFTANVQADKIVTLDTTITQEQTGTHEGFYYSFWNQGGGSVVATLGSGGNYSVNWSNCTNFTCGKGWRTGSPDRVVNFSGSFYGGNNGYLGLYGWTKNPLVEYWVIENYGAWTPPGTNPIGTMESDGGTYNLYKIDKTWQHGFLPKPSYEQFFSVRTSKRSSGTITFANHVNAWKSNGFDLGTTWDYQLMMTEGYQSSGSSNITVGEGAPQPQQTPQVLEGSCLPSSCLSPTSTPTSTPTPTSTSTPTSISTPTSTPTPPPASSVLLGDIDEDGQVTSIDFGMIRQYILGIVNSLPRQADVNQNGSIESLDFAAVRMFLIGKIDDLGKLQNTKTPPQTQWTSQPQQTLQPQQRGGSDFQKIVATDQTGTHNGYFYSFWNQGGGSVVMTLGSGGNYSVNWSNCSNFTCGKGWRTGSPNKNVNYSGTFNGGTNGYLALYGWTKNPLIEYYVIENYGQWTPPGSNAIGSFTSDGSAYSIHKVVRTNQPSIIGTATFDQYFSVRQQKRSNGTITFANHVNGWKSKGMNIGTTWDYVIMECEGYQSSGSANITVSGW